MAEPDIVRVTFAKVDSTREMKPRYIDGWQVPSWEDGPDLLSYLRLMMALGYVCFTKTGNVYNLHRRGSDYDPCLRPQHE